MGGDQCSDGRAVCLSPGTGFGTHLGIDSLGECEFGLSVDLGLDLGWPVFGILFDPAAAAAVGRVAIAVAGVGDDLIADFIGMLVAQFVRSAFAFECGELGVDAGGVDEGGRHFGFVLLVDPADDLGHRCTGRGGGVEVGGESLAGLAVPVVAVGHCVGLGLGGFAEPCGDAHGAGPVAARRQR